MSEYNNKYIRIHDVILHCEYIRKLGFNRRTLVVTWLGGQTKKFPLRYEVYSGEAATYVKQLKGESGTMLAYNIESSPEFIQLADTITIGNTIDWIFFDEKHKVIQIKYMCGKVDKIPNEILLSDDEKDELLTKLNEAGSGDSSPVTVC